MRLKLITNDNVRDYEDFLPDVFTTGKELLGVACIDETEDEDIIMGVSVVFPNETAETLEILWMYVQPEQRRRGAGSLMLDGIREMAREAGLTLVDVCFWGEDTEEEEADEWLTDPAEEDMLRIDEGDHEENPSEIGILKSFLLDAGFLTMADAPVYSFRISDVTSSDYVREHQKNKDSKLMNAYECKSWAEVPKSVREEVRAKIIQAGFRDLTPLCVASISFVCFKGGEIAGCILVTDDPSESRITIMLLVSFSPDPICTAKLIAISGDGIIERYPEDYRISFVSMNENTMKLLETILGSGNRISLDGYTVRGILEA